MSGRRLALIVLTAGVLAGCYQTPPTYGLYFVNNLEQEFTTLEACNTARANIAVGEIPLSALKCKRSRP